jgi:hypothetical protein
LNWLICNIGLEKELGELKDTAQYVMDLCVPQEEGALPEGLVDQLDEAESQINDLLLDTAKLVAATTLSTVKYHKPSFNLQRVSEDVDLSGLVRREDIMADDPFHAVGRLVCSTYPIVQFAHHVPGFFWTQAL